jgi:hypothetical protein
MLFDEIGKAVRQFIKYVIILQPLRQIIVDRGALFRKRLPHSKQLAKPIDGVFHPDT